MRMRTSDAAHLLVALAITCAARPALAEPAPSPEEEARAFRFMGGVALTGTGVLGLVIGGVLGVRAVVDKEAIGAHCDAMHRCDVTGFTLGSEARGSAVISTIGFAMGLGGMAAGIGLLVSAAPKKAATSAWIAPAPGGFTAGVRW
jgi:hypothetical protein